eukprot:scaffold190360_cov44-Tisochrysis_lutea.AAC.2
MNHCALASTCLLLLSAFGSLGAEAQPCLTSQRPYRCEAAAHVTQPAVMAVRGVGHLLLDYRRFLCLSFSAFLPLIQLMRHADLGGWHSCDTVQASHDGSRAY